MLNVKTFLNQYENIVVLPWCPLLDVEEEEEEDEDDEEE